jgi:signal peptidase I
MRRRQRHAAWWVELGAVVAVALVTSLVLKTFLFQAFWIPSGSMETTLVVGDRVIVEKVTGRWRDIHRGDVVVFRDPGGWLTDPVERPGRNAASRLVGDGLAFVGLAPDTSGDDLIKRVIGVEGDRVVCCDRRARITVNGVPLDEPYVFAGDAASDQRFNVLVPPGRLWVMGDHRGFSQDSRAHQGDGRGGMVPVDHVIGRAVVIVWPIDRMARLLGPSTFDQPQLGGR